MAGINRPMSQMRKMEAKEALFRNRKRILKFLVLGFLRQEGCFHSAETFLQEASLGEDHEVCDNMDLDIILQDYINFYLIRFNKQPQFIKKKESQPPQRPQTRKQRRKPNAPTAECEKADADLPASFTVTKLYKEPPESPKESPVNQKPLAVLLKNASPEKKELVEMLYQDIIRPRGVSWDDVKGLAAAKSLLMESLIYPIKYPEVFTGLLEPWRGILLHGPPGTGKTLLARAAGGEGCCTFFNVTCGTIVNKWRGESEKIVQVLFEMASYYSPSIIFIDEVETVASDRSSTEHEASRRLRSQLLTELDGVDRREGMVFLLANSNMPWDLDPAMLRRLEKRIYIPLPDFKTRVELFEKFLGAKHIEMVPKVDFQELASKTEGYSGSDIKLVCKEALMSTVRKLLPAMSAKGGMPARKDKLPLSEVLTAIEKTKPVSKHLTKRHEEWQSAMGCS